MSLSTYKKAINLVADTLERDNQKLYLTVLEAKNGVLIGGGKRHLDPIKARADAVRQVNRDGLYCGYLATIDGDDFLLLHATHLDHGKDRHTGNRNFLMPNAHAYRRPIWTPPAAIVVPSRRGRRSPLAGRLAQRLAS